MHMPGNNDEEVQRLRKALQGFGGVRRRFTRTGEWNGVPIIDDYGHHPVEIAAVLRAALRISKKRTSSCQTGACAATNSALTPLA